MAGDVSYFAPAGQGTQSETRLEVVPLTPLVMFRLPLLDTPARRQHQRDERSSQNQMNRSHGAYPLPNGQAGHSASTAGYKAKSSTEADFDRSRKMDSQFIRNF